MSTSVSTIRFEGLRVVLAEADAAAATCPGDAADAAWVGRDAVVAPRGHAAAVGGDGTLVVASRAAHRVARFDIDGALVAAWGDPGTAPGAFRDPRAVAVLADGRVAVADALNARLQVFAPNGELDAVWAAPGRALFAAGLAGAAARALFAPSALAALPDGGLIVASDLPDGEVVRLAGDGSPTDVLGGPGAPRRPTAVAASPGSGTVAAASATGRVAVYAGGRWSAFEVAVDPAGPREATRLPVVAWAGDDAVWLAARGRQDAADAGDLLLVDRIGRVLARRRLPIGFGVGGVAAAARQAVAGGGEADADRVHLRPAA